MPSFCINSHKSVIVESGVVTKDSDLFKTITGKTGSITVKKTLKELAKDGIITTARHMTQPIPPKQPKLIDPYTHSDVGSWVNKSKEYPQGRLENGGHSQACISELERRGIDYSIEATYKNGVRIGGVDNHNNRNKRIGTKGQAWFPEDWTADDIIVAGTYTANKSTMTGNIRFATYRSVRVGVFIDLDKNCIDTIFPDNSMQPFNDGWETLL